MKHLIVASIGAIMIAGVVNAQAIIDNGVVQLGVDEFGQLNIDGPTPSPVSGTFAVGLRHLPTGNEATSHGCLCEGWGVGIGETGVLGFANNDQGTDNLTGVLFSSTASTAISTVRLISGELEVTHAFAPSAKTANLYEVKVSITNTSGVDITDLRYTRTFDWDIEPDTFSEVVTISGTGTTPSLLFTTNNGFVSSNPFESRSTIDGYVENTDVVDFGPTDHGTNFDFGFGALADGATFEFSIFYGAAGTEAAALNSLGLVAAELFSLGQAGSDPLGTGFSSSGLPTATFIFAFAGIGGDVIIPDPTPPIPLPASVFLLAGGLGAIGALRRRAAKK